jgi:hypothetical protein
MSTELPPVNLQHLDRLLTPLGIWQHTRYGEPWVEHGFSIDDQARGLIVGAWLKWLQPREPAWLQFHDPQLPDRLIEICLRYIEQAQLPDGRFHNFRDAEGGWLDEVGSEDSFGRTIWSLYTVRKLLPDTSWAERASRLLHEARRSYERISALRAVAFLCLEEESSETLRLLGSHLVEHYRLTREPDWRWFEPFLTYENPRLPQAVLLAGSRLQLPDWLKIAREALLFLAEVTFAPTGYFNPVGNEGWYFRGRSRALFDQQPVCAGATVEAFLDAWQVFDRYELLHEYAQRALLWYHGDNIHQIALYDPQTGVVYDGLTPTGLNLNRGAESVLSYLLARIKWEIYHA